MLTCALCARWWSMVSDVVFALRFYVHISVYIYMYVCVWPQWQFWVLHSLFSNLYFPFGNFMIPMHIRFGSVAKWNGKQREKQGERRKIEGRTRDIDQTKMYQMHHKMCGRVHNNWIFCTTLYISIPLSGIEINLIHFIRIHRMVSIAMNRYIWYIYLYILSLEMIFILWHLFPYMSMSR